MLSFINCVTQERTYVRTFEAKRYKTSVTWYVLTSKKCQFMNNHYKIFKNEFKINFQKIIVSTGFYFIYKTGTKYK